MKNPKYFDCTPMQEDQRINLIGHRAVDHGERVGFFVEDEKKAARYIEKLKKKFPTIVVIGQSNDAVKGVTLVTVGPPSVNYKNN